MICSFLPEPVTPVMVLRLPYSGESFEDIIRHLNSDGAVSEARDTIEASFCRQREAMEWLLQVSACLGVFPVLTSVDERGPSHLDFRLPSDFAWVQGSSLAGLAVATVGDSVGTECSRLYKRGEYIDALVLDAMASTALEGAIREVREEMKATVKEMGLGQNLFPGTQQMPIDVLRTIFRLLRPDERIDVRLSEDMIMIPLRSTSVVIPCVPIAKTLS